MKSPETATDGGCRVLSGAMPHHPANGRMDRGALAKAYLLMARGLLACLERASDLTVLIALRAFPKDLSNPFEWGQETKTA
jgi:hypothetical protein